MNTTRTRRYRCSTLVRLGLVAGGPSAAAEEGGWNFEATPYLFAAGLDGTAGARGIAF